MSEQGKVIRVEIEYENADIERATGKDATTIWDAICGGFAFKQIHGMPYSGPKMKLVLAEAALRAETPAK